MKNQLIEIPAGIGRQQNRDWVHGKTAVMFSRTLTHIIAALVAVVIIGKTGMILALAAAGIVGMILGIYVVPRIVKWLDPMGPIPMLR